jgi:hypothetical protein
MSGQLADTHSSEACTTDREGQSGGSIGAYRTSLVA